MLQQNHSHQYDEVDKVFFLELKIYFLIVYFMNLHKPSQFLQNKYFK